MTDDTGRNLIAQTTPPPEFLTVSQVAAILAVPVHQVNEWASAGAFARFFIDGQLLIHQQDILDILYAALIYKVSRD